MTYAACKQCSPKVTCYDTCEWDSSRLKYNLPTLPERSCEASSSVTDIFTPTQKINKTDDNSTMQQIILANW